MQVYQGISQFSHPNFTIVTSGTFDGVHQGHQKILARLREISQEKQGEIVLITFWPHPRLILGKDADDLKLINTIEEKIELLEKYGVDHLVILPFTQEFSQLSPEEFIQKIYIKGIGTQKLIIGYDHRFGKNRAGSLEYLQSNIDQYPFSVEEISRQDIDEVGVSSTRIRNALLAGEINTANQYLGHHYTLQGEVMHGDKIGRTLGFPTANLSVAESYKLIPADGIYAITAQVKEKSYKGMLYIGTRPTISKQVQRRIEVNLFDFEEDIYGEQMRIWFIEKIRDDQKFESLEVMKEQLKEDGKKSIEILKNY